MTSAAAAAGRGDTATIRVRERLRALGRRGRSHIPPLGREVLDEWRVDRLGGLAAEIAFFAVLSVFPAVLAIVAALAFLDAVLGSRLAMDVRDTVIGFLHDMLTAEGAETVAAVRDLFERKNPALVSVATVGTLWSVSRGVYGAARALNVAYDLPEPRSWLRMRMKAVALGTGSVLLFVLMLAVIVTGPLLGGGRFVGEVANVPGGLIGAWLWLRYPIAFALLICWAMLMFHFAPNQRSPLRWEVSGAIVTGALWLASSLGFRLYLTLGAKLNQVLGALGGALILMLWLYLLSLSLLLGAEVNDVLARRRRWVREAREH